MRRRAGNRHLSLKVGTISITLYLPEIWSKFTDGTRGYINTRKKVCGKCRGALEHVVTML